MPFCRLLLALTFAKLLFALPLMLPAVNLSYGRAWKPEASIDGKVEASIKAHGIPQNFAPEQSPTIAQYARYYFGYEVDNHRMISGELVIPFGRKMQPAGVYIVDGTREFPTVNDGGCAVMHVIFDVEENRLVSLKCNGFA